MDELPDRSGDVLDGLLEVVKEPQWKHPFLLRKLKENKIREAREHLRPLPDLHKIEFLDSLAHTPPAGFPQEIPELEINPSVLENLRETRDKLDELRKEVDQINELEEESPSDMVKSVIQLNEIKIQAEDIQKRILKEHRELDDLLDYPKRPY